MKLVASVVISRCTREFDKEYHYTVPEELAGKIKVGARVIVPFGKGNSLKEAYVLSLPEGCSTDGLKEIKKLVDEEPALGSTMLKLAVWMKERYICTYSDAIRCMLPPGSDVRGVRVARLLTTEGVSGKNCKKIVAALEASDGECEFGELKRITAVKDFLSCMRKLEAEGFISVVEEYSSRIREKTVRVAYLARPVEETIDDIESGRIKRIQHIRILEMLVDNNYISTADLARFAGVSPGVLETLRKYGYIDYKDIEVKRDPLKHVAVERTQPFAPTEQQAEVIKQAVHCFDRDEYCEMLIHGVTGSGKTEVYLQLIRHCLDCGKNAIVLVPEISLTPQMVERFKGRFGNDVAVLHSRLSLGERYDQWRLIREGRIKVAVGARSAVFAPFENVGLIIVDEEHESSYKSEINPRYHAVDVARERCKLENALLVLGSATPSVETFYRAEKGDIELAVMTARTNSMVMPGVELVNMREELDEGNRSIFSRKLSEEIRKNIDSGQQTLLFLNRRGYASFVLCRKCGYVVKCNACNISMTYHSYDDRLICHYCGYTTKNFQICPKCGSNYIKQFGTGTQKVEEEVAKQFPGSSVIRMDMDTTTCKNSHEEILRTFREKNINILVGTQMIAKGHDFPNITLVGVLAADSLLNTGDYRASERTFQLLTQVAGRAGRGTIPGRVIVQTYNTDDFSIQAACRHDYSSFYRQELKMREMLTCPPYTNISVVNISGVNDKYTFITAQKLKADIEKIGGEYGCTNEILGPARSPVSKIKNKYRWRIIVKCRELDNLVSMMTRVSDRFYSDKNRSMALLSIDINPYNML